jgi:anaerobic dimethyl sulfoxide reductase subunit B (iron-sulfur subunit)
MTQMGFYIDNSKCIGCKTCMIACKDGHNLIGGINYRRVYEYTGGKWTHEGNTFQQNVFSYYISIACNHCNDPACTKVCPTGAINKRAQDGIVVIDKKICIGCKMCAMACPYEAPQYNRENKYMTKCDFCLDRLNNGYQPLCVEACIARAIDYGEIFKLKRKYPYKNEPSPLPDYSITKPNLIVKPPDNLKNNKNIHINGQIYKT